MTGIFEALEKADQQARRVSEEPMTLLSVPSRVDSDIVEPQDIDPVAGSMETHLEDSLSGLYQAVQSALRERGGKVVHFVGARRGEGASTLAREFAKVVALRLGKSALILDANREAPCQAAYFGGRPAIGWGACVQEDRPHEESTCRIGESPLFVSQMVGESDGAASLPDGRQLDGFFDLLRQDFDLTVIDSAPVTDSPEGLGLAGKADGVILVVEAGKTRRQTVADVCEAVVEHGGRMLGVVLNKRRYPIPKLIYKRL